MSTKPNFSHTPPHSNELESAVLGGMILEAEGLSTALSLLRQQATVFYQPTHQAIFRAVLELHQLNQAVDVVSVTQQLMKMGTLTKAGGPAGVAELVMKVAGAAHIGTHCLQLLELFTRRTIIDTARRLLAKGYDETNEATDLVAEAQSSINLIHDTLQLKRPQAVGELYDSVVDDIVTATTKSGLTGVPAGLSILDRLTGGWQASDLIIIAARPGMGKTSLMLANGRHAAGAGFPGAIFSLEMGAKQLVRKMIATEAGYTTAQLQKGKLDGGAEEAEHIRRKAEALRSIGLYIDDTAALSIGELRAKATKLKADHGITWLAVDYLQLMRGDGKGNREQEIASISRGLKELAKELSIPVIALSQLSRSVESRGGDKRPMLSDLRESGAIEQDADMIIFPFRPEYYKIMEDEFGASTADTTELIVAKHRNGSTATGDEALVVSSKMAFGRYSDLDTSPAPAGEKRFYDGEQVVQLGRLPQSSDFMPDETDPGF